MSKINTYLLAIPSIILVLSMYLPFIEVRSFNKIHSSSKLIDMGEFELYETNYYGIESGDYFVLIALILLIVLIAHFSENPIGIVMLFLITLFYGLYLVYIYAKADIGGATPIGDNLLIGYKISLISSSIIILESYMYKFGNKVDKG